MVELEQMREKYELQGRVELLGRVNPGDVRDVSLLDSQSAKLRLTWKKRFSQRVRYT